MEPKKCRHNPKILCGVVKNVGHCPFPTEALCDENNATNFLGRVNHSFGTITLQKYRYNHHKIKISVLEDNMCHECRVIWADLMNCPICKGDDET